MASFHPIDSIPPFGFEFHTWTFPCINLKQMANNHIITLCIEGLFMTGRIEQEI